MTLTQAEFVGVKTATWWAIKLWFAHPLAGHYGRFVSPLVDYFCERCRDATPEIPVAGLVLTKRAGAIHDQLGAPRYTDVASVPLLRT
jgi:hypothetical protein